MFEASLALLLEPIFTFVPIFLSEEGWDAAPLFVKAAPLRDEVRGRPLELVLELLSSDRCSFSRESLSFLHSSNDVLLSSLIVARALLLDFEYG